MATAAEIAKTFEAALIPIDPEQADLLAAQLNATHNDLERLIGELLHSDHKASQSGLLVALAFKSALADEADPVRIVRRLRRQADAADVKAERAIEEGAECAGKAAGRRLRAKLMTGQWAASEVAQAEAFERRAAACHAETVEATTEAFEKRKLADRIERQLPRSADLTDTVLAIAGAHLMAAE